MPVCLLEVNTTTTSLVASFRYDKINDSVLKFAVGDEITMHCNYGYKAVHPNFTMVCKDENNGSWSHDPIECHGMYLNARHGTFHISSQVTALARQVLLGFFSDNFDNFFFNSLSRLTTANVIANMDVFFPINLVCCDHQLSVQIQR